MTGNLNQKDCNDSSSDKAYKDPFSSRNLSVWASSEKPNTERLRTITKTKRSPTHYSTVKASKQRR